MNKKKTKDNDNVIKYPKQYHVSIGFIIIGVMFIYICYHVFTYLTSKNITIYEVTQGTISSNLEYNALAFRQEEIVTAPMDGYIVYLSENLGKVSVKSKVYAIDQTGDIVSNMTDVSLSDNNVNISNLSNLSSFINGYTLEYDNNSFGKLYSFKADLSSQIGQLYNLTAMDAHYDEINSAVENGTFYVFKSDRPGLVVYQYDGMESLSLEDYSSDSFDTTNYSVRNLRAQSEIREGDVIYKLITSDKWNLVMEIDSSLAKELAEDKYIQIRFLEDETETWASYEIEEKAGRKYLVLSLDDSMDRFASSRFIHVKLLNSGKSGLKIPNSSIVEKEFFTIPKEYFYGDEDSTERGLLVENGNNTDFRSTTIYYETDDFYYVDGLDIAKGETIVKANSLERYKVGAQTDSLLGVYNVNKGYAVFKQIEILYQNEDYAIIKSGTSYGISMYDHIVLQGDAVSENDIIN